MSTTAAILQPGYLPWLGAFEQMARADVFVFLDDVQYTRRDWRNRNRIKGPNGEQMLVVPVKSSGRRDQLILEAVIDGDSWRAKHLRALTLAYGKSPWFERYRDDLTELYGREWVRLVDLDMELTLWLAGALGIDRRFRRSSELSVESDDRSGRIVGIMNAVGAEHLYDGKAARAFIDVDEFGRQGIEVTFQEYEHPVYAQLWPKQGFISHLSALDLLLNCGPDSLEILRSGGSA